MMSRFNGTSRLKICPREQPWGGWQRQNYNLAPWGVKRHARIPDSLPAAHPDAVERLRLDQFLDT